MAEQEPTPGTDGAGAIGTDGNTPPATPTPPTPPNGNPAAATPAATGDETVTLNKEDYQNLISQRDKGNENARTLEERHAQLEYEYYKGKAVDKFTTEYPEVPREVLEAAESPEQMETLAKAFQAHAEAAREKALKEVTNVRPDQLTPEQKTDKLEKLKGTGKLTEALDVMLS